MLSAGCQISNRLPRPASFRRLSSTVHFFFLLTVQRYNKFLNTPNSFEKICKKYSILLESSILEEFIILSFLILAATSPFRFLLRWPFLARVRVYVVVVSFFYLSLYKKEVWGKHYFLFLFLSLLLGCSFVARFLNKFRRSPHCKIHIYRDLSLNICCSFVGQPPLSAYHPTWRAGCSVLDGGIQRAGGRDTARWIRRCSALDGEVQIPEIP